MFLVPDHVFLGMRVVEKGQGSPVVFELTSEKRANDPTTQQQNVQAEVLVCRFELAFSKLVLFVLMA